MKKLSQLTIAFVLLVSSPSMGGDLIAFGLKGGLAFNSASTDEDIGTADIKGYTGYQFGAYTRINLPIVMGFKGELLYTAKGYDIEAGGLTSTARTSWVEIPILLSFGLFGKVEFDIGPQFSFLVSDKVKNFDGTDGELPSDFSSSEISLALGVDVNIIKKLGAYLRYNYGFGSNYTSGGQDYKFSNSTLQVGVKFRIMN